MNKQKMKSLVRVGVYVLIVFFAIGASVTYALSIPQTSVDLTHPITGNEPMTLLEISNIVGTIANFLVIVAPVLIIIALVLSAITIMSGGANPAAVKKGKEWLKYSIYGGLIIFGSGVIINTIAYLVTRDFFCQVMLLGVCILK
jgi:hypothetical protein